MGCPIIMGRKTYEDHASALPGRLNLVVTSQQNYSAAQGVVVVSSLEQAYQVADEAHHTRFVIGGVSLFNAAYPQADRVYETVVHTQIVGDTVLPAYDFAQWDTQILQTHPADDKHPYAFTVYQHDRRDTPA